jgi:hypothetical protein
LQDKKTRLDYFVEDGYLSKVGSCLSSKVQCKKILSYNYIANDFDWIENKMKEHTILYKRTQYTIIKSKHYSENLIL